MNYGLDLDKEEREESKEDWEFVVGGSRKCLASIPPSERKKYLPPGEVQRGVEDMMDCATRSAVSIIETKLNYLLAMGLLSPAQEAFLRDNGYVTANGVELSDAFVAINSRTTRNGNSLKAPPEAIRKQGLVPKALLPLEKTMTFDQYHDPRRITKSIEVLGMQFLQHLSINYEKVYREDFAELLKEDILDVAGHAWSIPNRNGLYPRIERPYNHAWMNYDNPDFQAFDNYIDSHDGDFTKHLAYDYDFYKYGYRLYITEREAREVNWLGDLFARILAIFTPRRILQPA